jgi:hypothetical protein
MIFKRPYNARLSMRKPLASGLAASLLLLVLSSYALAAAPGEAPNPKGGKFPFPRPRSHSAAWLEFHGSAVEPAATDPGNTVNCLVCHEKTDCVSCHSVRAPRDHTNTWRTLSHGFMAEGNRERCLTCHRQDFCVRCHNETAPRSHTGNWSGRHCTWCHFGSGLAPADACGICHRIAPHSSAPHMVNPQTNCVLCHK